MAFGLFKGGDVNISLQLDRPAGPYYPGDVVHTDIMLEVEKGMKVQEVRAGLVFWERYQWIDRDTEGKTSRRWSTDEAWVSREILVPKGSIPDDFRQTYSLDWRIPPEAQPPYAGTISQTRWLVKVTVARRLKKDINEEIELPLIVPPPGHRAQPDEYGESSHPDAVHMRLRLPGLEFVEGETINGQLLIEPRQDFGVSEVRLELVRGEYVPRDEGNRHTAIEQKLQLARKAKFQAGTPVVYDFTLDIPDQGCPTSWTNNSRVNWAIRATLNRRLRKDFKIEQAIFVYNGPAPN
ncbi:MAG: hypothetical protein DRI80_15850 [Chloroflexota bacterium]|nr:MAG: hypothetical protein DRI80_15850 [Chloroflexota bacterium]